MRITITVIPDLTRRKPDMTWKLQRHMSQKAIATESRGTSGLKLQHCQTSGSPTPQGFRSTTSSCANEEMQFSHNPPRRIVTSLTSESADRVIRHSRGHITRAKTAHSPRPSRLVQLLATFSYPQRLALQLNHSGCHASKNLRATGLNFRRRSIAEVDLTPTNS